MRRFGVFVAELVDAFDWLGRASKLPLGVAVVSALALVLAGCNSSGSAVMGRVSDRLEQAIAKYGQPVAQVVIGSSVLSVDFYSEGVRTKVQLLPEEKVTTEPGSNASAQKDFSLAEAMARASQLSDECNGDYRLTVNVVAATVVHTAAVCKAKPVWAQLNDTKLPVMEALWNAETLAVLWAEFKIVAPDMKVRRVELSNLVPHATVDLIPDPSTPPGICPAWARSMGEPWLVSEVFRGRPCEQPNPLLLDLEAISSQRVAELVVIGQQRTGIERLEGVAVLIEPSEDGPQITVHKGSRSVTLPIKV